MMSESKTDERPEFMRGIYVPPQPSIIKEIREASPDLPKIAHLIAKDAAISANVLRTVNSPAYNLPMKISSINQAVVLLGLDSVINVVNGLLIRETFEKYEVDNLVEFWQLNEEMAICASLLSRRLGLAVPEEAYLLALFHNCGVPAMNRKFPNYNELLRTAYEQNECTVVDYVERQINTNHRTVGYFIARTWDLPEHICESIRDHEIRFDTEGLSRAKSDLLVCLKLAENICQLPQRLFGCRLNSHWGLVSEIIFSILHFSDEDYEDLEHEIRESILLSV